MNYLFDNYPEYDCDIDGNVYKGNKEITPFNSSGYLQVLLFDKNHKRKVAGVHTVVAMKYKPEYFDGCVVHHENENKHDNSLANLVVMDKVSHSKLHRKNVKAKYIIFKCPNCGKIFERRKNKITWKNNTDNFHCCSRHCSGQFTNKILNDKSNREYYLAIKNNIIGEIEK